MVNTNIQGSIPIDGAGFVAKRNGNYRQGEFKRLSNMEIVDGILRNRNSVQSVYGSTPGPIVDPLVNGLGFVGDMVRHVIAVNNTEQFAYGTEGRVTMWAPTLLPVPVGASSFHRILGFFRYNDNNYWITLEYEDSVEVNVCLYHGPIDIADDHPSSYDNAYFATLTRSVIQTYTVSSPDFIKFRFRNFFIHNERLWLILSNGIYFSKATDPTVFSVPDGGFFKFPDEVVNWGMSLKDSLYILGNKSIHMVTYTADPNVDGSSRRISDMGADKGCIYQDTPYVINQVGLYRINSTYVEKVMDNEFDVGTDFYKNEITAFQNYLIVNKYSEFNYEKLNSTQSLTRVNLIHNPGAEEMTGNGYVGSTNFMIRERTFMEAKRGDNSFRAEKINDTSAVHSKNLVLNPSATNNLNTWRSTLPRAVLTRITGASPISGGNTYFKCTRIENNDNGINMLSDRYTIPAEFKGLTNTQVYFSGAFRFYAENPNSIFSLDLEIRIYNSSNTRIRTITGGLLSRGSLFGDPDPFDVWKIVSRKWGSYSAAETATWDTFEVYIYSYFKNNDPGDFFNADGITLSLGPLSKDSTFNNQPYDGETTDTSSFVYEWEGAVGASRSIKYGISGYDPSTYPPNDTAIYEHDDLIPVEPNTSYTLAFNVKSDVSTIVTVVFHRYDSLGVLIDEGGFTSNQVVETDPGKWKEGWIQWYSGSTPDMTYIKFYISTTTSLTNGDEFFIDTLHFELSDTYNGIFDGSYTDIPSINYSWEGTPHDSNSLAVVTSSLRTLYRNGREFTPGRAGNTLGYNTYFINMDTGSVHVFDFKDGRDGTVTPGYPVQFYVNPYKDNSGNYNLMFMTSRIYADTEAELFYNQHVYYLNSAGSNTFYDMAVDGSNELQKYPPAVDIEIDSYVPDGNEYLTKKFRNFLMMGKFTLSDLLVKFGFDNGAYGTTKTLGSSGATRPHSPTRVGINQRAKALSVRITNEDVVNEPLVNEDYGNIEISDIRVLWSYTARGINKKPSAIN